MDKNIYIITNSTSTGTYTPSKANSLEEARDWMYECTADNLRSWLDGEYDNLDEMEDKELLVWAEENIDGHRPHARCFSCE